MMTGIAPASHPNGLKCRFISEYACITLFPVRRPMAISVVIKAKPKVTAKIR